MGVRLPSDPLNQYHRGKIMSSRNDEMPMTKGQFGCLAVFAGAILVAIFIWATCWVTVDKGHVGAMSWFGDVEDKTLEPGPHLVHPFKKVYRMNVQTQKNEEPATVPTSNGLSIGMTATMLYHLDPAKAPKMAREVGSTDYESRVIDPVFKNNVRDVCAKYPPEVFYSGERQKVETEIMMRTQSDLDQRGVVVESIMLLDPVLPEVVVSRIQAKAGAEQDAQRMEFVLKQKELEAKAKVVEAKGIADAQAIIKKDLDHAYLVYLWIEALKESAKHNNATIYIPTGGDGMPLFRNVEGKR